MLLGWEADLLSPPLPVSSDCVHGEGEEHQLQWVCAAPPEQAAKVPDPISDVLDLMRSLPALGWGLVCESLTSSLDYS